MGAKNNVETYKLSVPW